MGHLFFNQTSSHLSFIHCDNTGGSSKDNCTATRSKLCSLRSETGLILVEKVPGSQSFNLPCEVFLPHHVAGNRRVPGRGDLGWRVHWLWLHRPHVVMADVVVHHCWEGWREGQASRGKERMITTQAQTTWN